MLTRNWSFRYSGWLKKALPYLCCLPIFPGNILRCSQTFISLKNSQKPNWNIVWVRWTFLHERAEVQFVMFSYKTLFHRQQTIYRILKQTKLSSIYRRNLLCPDETSRVACNSGETQTRKVLLLFGRDRIYGEILAIGWQEEGNFEVNRCYIQIYLAKF